MVSLQPGTVVRIDAGLRPGVYVSPPASLLDVPVTRNNRAVLLAQSTVARLMTESVEAELFVPLPMWFAAFAGDRPPDLYLTQRTEFDALFSPTRAQVDVDGASRSWIPELTHHFYPGMTNRDQADRSRNKRPNGRARRGRESALPRTNVERRDQDRTSESPVRHEARDRGQSPVPSPWLSLQEGSPRLRRRHHSSTGCRVHTEACRGVHRWVLLAQLSGPRTSAYLEHQLLGPQLRINRDRDRRVDKALAQGGWTVIRVWEHEPPLEVADLVAAALEQATMFRRARNVTPAS